MMSAHERWLARREARAVAQIVGELMDNNSFAPEDVAVITPYVGQLRQLETELKRHQVTGPALHLWAARAKKTFLACLRTLVGLRSLFGFRSDFAAFCHFSAFRHFSAFGHFSAFVPTFRLSVRLFGF